MKRRQPPICLTPKCGRPVKSCGLCPNCHQACARMIRSGLATEHEMIVAGLMLEPTFRGQRMGRPPASFRVYALKRLDSIRRQRFETPHAYYPKPK